MSGENNQNQININNFYGQNLRGKSFKNQNLAGVNFCKADIRGADFSGANLIGANFREVSAGLPLKWKINLAFTLLFVAAFAGFITTLAGFWLTFFLAHDSRIIAGIIYYLLWIAVFFTVNIYKGLLFTVVIMLLTLPVTIPVAEILTIVGQGDGKGAGAGAGIAAITVVGVMLIVIAITCTRVIIRQRVAVITVIFAMVGAVLGALVGKTEERFTLSDPDPNGHALNVKLGFMMALLVAASLLILTVYIAWISLPKEKNSNVIPGIAVTFAAIGGTNFRNANLTEADFTRATLNNTNFQGANLTRTRWFRAKELERTKLDGTILSDSKVRDLLVNLRVNHESASFMGLNFRGAFLAGADLSYINLTEAEISEATFAGANLEYANLTKAQAINTNFQQTKLTGACLEAWNIDSTTELSGAICEYVYLLNNQQERRPSSGEFQPGEFTKLFQEVLDTVDLIFRNGIDWKAFTYSFNQLQIENEGAELSIRSIENKGDGVVVVRVDVPQDADKSKIYSEFTQVYDTTVKILEEKYRGEIESKDKQIDIYRQHLADLQKVLQLFEKPPANISHKSKVVILKFGEGDFHTGFPVTLQIAEERKSISLECVAKLPAFPEIIETYHNWQSAYRQSLNAVFRVDVPQSQITNISNSNFLEECSQLAENIQNSLNLWLNSSKFRTIKEQMLEELNRGDSIRIILQTENEQLRRLPWHLWNIFERYLKAEIAISNQAYRLINNNPRSPLISEKSQVRILVILGYSHEIDVQKDKLYLEQLTKKAEITYLTNPTRKELQEKLWHQTWDILYFAGHSFSSADSQVGYIRINQTERLTIADLKYALANAIENGLKLAIFNSCDGLGLASNLANLHIPQMIVMREWIPDEVAQEFLRNFLKAFVDGKSLYQSVRDAREQLQHWENWFPCATWLPIIFQNPAEIPPTWSQMEGMGKGE